MSSYDAERTSSLCFLGAEALYRIGMYSKDASAKGLITCKTLRREGKEETTHSVEATNRVPTPTYRKGKE
jgi:hypothetical protein